MTGLVHNIISFLLVAVTAAAKDQEFSQSVVFDGAYDCPPGKFGYDGTVKRHFRYSPWTTGTQTVSGNITFALPFNDTYWVNVTVAALTTNGWQENAIVFYLPTAACSYFRTNQPTIMNAITGQGEGVGEGGPCNVAPGTYEIEEARAVKAVLGLIKYPLLSYGNYRFLQRSGIYGFNAALECVVYILRLLPS